MQDFENYQNSCMYNENALEKWIFSFQERKKGSQIEQNSHMYKRNELKEGIASGQEII